MVWLYVIGWSTYGPEAPATFAPEFIDTKNDTRKAIASTGALNVLPGGAPADRHRRHHRLPGRARRDLTGIVYMIDVFEAVVGDALSYVMVLFLCAGLLLAMNTATMDGSRALYALSRENMTLKQLGALNSHHVPARAMTLDMLLNIFLLFAFPTTSFILAAGNLGYMLSHVLALTGFLLLRRDRPTGHVRSSSATAGAGRLGCLAVNLVGTSSASLYQVHRLHDQGRRRLRLDPTGDPCRRDRARGRRRRLRHRPAPSTGGSSAGDPWDEQPPPEAYQLARAARPGERTGSSRRAAGALARATHPHPA